MLKSGSEGGRTRVYYGVSCDGNFKCLQCPSFIGPSANDSVAPPPPPVPRSDQPASHGGAAGALVRERRNEFTMEPPGVRAAAEYASECTRARAPACSREQQARARQHTRAHKHIGRKHTHENNRTSPPPLAHTHRACDRGVGVDPPGPQPVRLPQPKTGWALTLLLPISPSLKRVHACGQGGGEAGERVGWQRQVQAARKTHQYEGWARVDSE
jgi:hypothetical protein